MATPVAYFAEKLSATGACALTNVCLYSVTTMTTLTCHFANESSAQLALG
jgi:hypothetical protein